MALDKASTVQDGGSPGHFVWGTEYEGIIYPLFYPAPPKQHLESIRKMPCSSGDTFICSFPKSGTHWIMEIVSMLKRGSLSHSGVCHFLDPMPSEVTNLVPDPRIFACHLRYDRLPEQAKSTGSKVVYCLRNPKDLAVSVFNFTKNNKSVTYTGTWEEFLDDFIQGKILYSSWFDHVRSWELAREQEKNNPILFVFYEDLKKDTHNEIRRIAEYLGVNVNDETVDAIVRNTSIARMREHKFTYFPHPAEMLDPDHLEILFRKGCVGEWKNWFTQEQNTRMDAMFKEKMKGSNLHFTFHLDEETQK